VPRDRCRRCSFRPIEIHARYDVPGAALLAAGRLERLDPARSDSAIRWKTPSSHPCSSGGRPHAGIPGVHSLPLVSESRKVGECDPDRKCRASDVGDAGVAADDKSSCCADYQRNLRRPPGVEIFVSDKTGTRRVELFTANPFCKLIASLGIAAMGANWSAENCDGDRRIGVVPCHAKPILNRRTNDGLPLLDAAD
jgi:hypothetical protein